jgi:hypothetical protein
MPATGLAHRFGFDAERETGVGGGSRMEFIELAATERVVGMRRLPPTTIFFPEDGM